MQNYIGIIGTIFGAIIGGAIAIFVSYRQQAHQRSLERDKRLIEKYEKLHESFGEASNSAATWANGILIHLGNDLPIKPNSLGEGPNLDHLRMLVDFYAPALKPESDALKNIWEKLVRLVAEDISGNKTPEWKSDSCEKVAFMSVEASNICTKAREKLANLVQQMGVNG